MSELNITNKIISYSGTMWQINNITQVTKYFIPKKWPFSLKSILISLVVGIIAASGAPEPIALIIAAASLGFSAYAIYRNAAAVDSHGVKLETSSGSSELLTSSDEDLIDSIIKKINQVMHSSDKPADFVFNVDNRTFTDNSTVITDSVVKESFNN